MNCNFIVKNTCNLIKCMRQLVSFLDFKIMESHIILFI